MLLPIQKSLRIAVAKVFCTSIERQLPDDQMLVSFANYVLVCIMVV